MDILSVQGLLAMLQIIVIDILLAGDNAIVIGMAARNLPAHLQKKAIFWAQPVPLFYALLWHSYL